LFLIFFFLRKEQRKKKNEHNNNLMNQCIKWWCWQSNSVVQHNCRPVCLFVFCLFVCLFDHVCLFVFFTISHKQNERPTVEFVNQLSKSNSRRKKKNLKNIKERKRKREREREKERERERKKEINK